MPRRTTPAATLEHQPTPALGDLDEHGNERLPTFDLEADARVESAPFEYAGEAKWTAPMGAEPSRDERIADLDERSERLNGHTPEGVRPSERCGFPSPLGIGCTFAKHANGLHSWTPEPIHDPVPGTEAEQPTLPGTPRRVVRPPQDAEFDGDFITSADIANIGAALIARHAELAYLDNAKIIYVWKQRGGRSGGNRTLGKCQKPGGLLRHFSRADYVIWLAADHARDLGFGQREFEALTFHELLHTEWIEEDEDTGAGRFGLRGHDFEGFVAELDAFGAWSADLRELHAHVAKLPLEQAIDDAQPEGDEGEDEE